MVTFIHATVFQIDMLAVLCYLMFSIVLFQDAHVHGLPSERPGIVRGFRKNIRGRWRRLVKRKPVTEVYTIPEDLRDQLKQIYVY